MVFVCRFVHLMKQNELKVDAAEIYARRLVSYAFNVLNNIFGFQWDFPPEPNVLNLCTQEVTKHRSEGLKSRSLVK